MLQLYDLAGIYYRAFYALPSSIVGPHGRPVGAIRGSLDMLARVIADAHPEQAVACLDVAWRPWWRVALIPSYKAHRVAEGTAGCEDTDGTEDIPEDLSWQVPIIVQILSAAGLSIAGAEECEADDVIATLVDQRKAHPIEIVSGDRDLFQLVREVPTAVSVRYIGAGMSKSRVVDHAALNAQYGVDGPGYAVMAALRGDASDGLPGVAGIGEKTAARLVRDYGTLTRLMAAVADPTTPLTPRVRQKLRDAAEYLEAVMPVVRVRTDASLEWMGTQTSGALPREPADPSALAELAATHGVASSVERLVAAIAQR